MKALILSDSHGAVGNMIEAYENERNIDIVMFSGDMHRDIEEFSYTYPRASVAEVIGNNDFFERNVPDERVFTYDGKRFFLTHGHKYGVKYSLAGLLKKAKEEKADICIYGHTHIKALEEIDGVIVINPGSARRSYAVLTIENGDIKVEFKEF